MLIGSILEFNLLIGKLPSEDFSINLVSFPEFSWCEAHLPFKPGVEILALSKSKLIRDILNFDAAKDQLNNGLTEQSALDKF